MHSWLFRILFGIVSQIVQSFISAFATKLKEDLETARKNADGEIVYTPEAVGTNLALYAYSLVKVAESSIFGGEAKHEYVFENLEQYAKSLGYALSVAALDRIIIGALAKLHTEIE